MSPSRVSLPILVPLLATFVAGCAQLPDEDAATPTGKADDTAQTSPVGYYAWRCSVGELAGSPDIELTHDGAKVLDARFYEYHVIADGMQRDDDAIGASVFGVEASDVTLVDGAFQFKLELQDYSDYQAWTVRLRTDGPGTIESRFNGGDGLNVHTSALTCDVTH